MSGSRHRVPTKVLAALRDGAKLVGVKTPPMGVAIPTSAPNVEIDPDDEPSIPNGMTISDRIEYRVQDVADGQIEIARQLGVSNGRLTNLEAEMQVLNKGVSDLVLLAGKADRREEKREESREKREEREADERTGKRSDRTKIILAVIGVLSLLAAGGGIGAVIRGGGASDTHASAKP